MSLKLVSWASTFELVPLCLDGFPSPMLREHPLMLLDEFEDEGLNDKGAKGAMEMTEGGAE